MIKHALFVPGMADTSVSFFERRTRVRVLRPPIRCYSGRDCKSCGCPIDRDAVCRCSF